MRHAYRLAACQVDMQIVCTLCARFVAHTHTASESDSKSDSKSESESDSESQILIALCVQNMFFSVKKVVRKKSFLDQTSQPASESVSVGLGGTRQFGDH